MGLICGPDPSQDQHVGLGPMLPQPCPVNLDQAVCHCGPALCVQIGSHAAFVQPYMPVLSSAFWDLAQPCMPRSGLSLSQPHAPNLVHRTTLSCLLCFPPVPTLAVGELQLTLLQLPCHQISGTLGSLGVRVVWLRRPDPVHRLVVGHPWLRLNNEGWLH